MLYNSKYLFLHIPRTAGKCVKSAILPYLEKPVYLAQNHIAPEYFTTEYRVADGSLVHACLSDLAGILPLQKLIIIAGLRNPIDRIKSIYAVDRRLGYPKGFEFYLKNDFGKKKWHKDTASFCLLDDNLPPNLHFVRFQNLKEDFLKILGIPIDFESKRHNASKISALSEDYRVLNKEACADIVNRWERRAIERGLLLECTALDFN